MVIAWYFSASAGGSGGCESSVNRLPTMSSGSAPTTPIADRVQMRLLRELARHRHQRLFKTREKMGHATPMVIQYSI